MGRRGGEQLLIGNLQLASLLDTILALRDANRSQARLIQTSAERTRVCQEYYDTSIKMAKMKCTHFKHLLKGLQNKNIGRGISILTVIL